MACRRVSHTLVGFIAGSLLVAAAGIVLAGERQEGVSRADLVTAMERGPGPIRGSMAAPIVMVEFSDFQCAYCRQFWRETLPKIEERYIRTGKVRLVYRHLAILGEASIQAAQAASCAHDQGKFWEYHDMLFSKASPLAFTASRLKRYAADLGVDQQAFAACVDSKKYAQRVEAETLIGRALGATGTPTFLINGQLLIGAYPFETFQEGLDSLLAARGQAPSGLSK